MDRLNVIERKYNQIENFYQKFKAILDNYVSPIVSNANNIIEKEDPSKIVKIISDTYQQESSLKSNLSAAIHMAEQDAYNHLDPNGFISELFLYIEVFMIDKNALIPTQNMLIFEGRSNLSKIRIYNYRSNEEAKVYKIEDVDEKIVSKYILDLIKSSMFKNE